MTVAFLLLLSGGIHLALFVILGATWNGPLSLRKPALFGISGGMTMWSIAWVLTHLQPKKIDGWLISTLSVALFVEVALITVQYWRQVPSHFNRATWLDASIELTMLSLILFVTGGIFYLTWRTLWLRTVEPAMATAIRGGMTLLALSCLLGIVTSVLGEVSLAAGRSYELWGKAGVLKFPHGVALHAIQMLPVLAWIAAWLGLNHSKRSVQAALVAQILFLIYSVWQTGTGRNRFDVDFLGAILLVAVAILSTYLLASFLGGCIKTWRGWHASQGIGNKHA